MSFLRKSFSTFQRRVKSAGAASAMGVAVLVAVIAPCPAAAANTDFCAGKTLDAGAPLGSPGPDLVITGTACTVDGSYKTYNFHNVYIFGGGSLVFDNATMDFYAANILVQNDGILQATGIGKDGEVLTIHLYGNQGDPGVSCKKMDNGQVVNDDTCGVPTSNPDVWDSNQMDMQWPETCIPQPLFPVTWTIAFTNTLSSTVATVAEPTSGTRCWRCPTGAPFRCPATKEPKGATIAIRQS